MQKTLTLAAAMATAAALPGAAQATSTTCSTSVVCSESINTYTGSPGGVAIHGEANAGIGVRGTSVTNTGFYGASGSGSMMAPGVEGESTNNTASDAAGAFGLAYLSSSGANDNAYGVLGYGAHVGASGTTSTAGSSSVQNFGVVGFDKSAYPTSDAAVAGISTAGAGLLAESNGTPTTGVYSYRPIGLYAVAEPNGKGNQDAIAIEAESTSYPFESRNPAASDFIDLSQVGYLIYGGGLGSGQGYFYVTQAGNATFSGTVHTSGGTYARTAGTSGTARIAYGTRSTAPEIEDVGEGNLVNGHAVVAIDPALADTIDMRHPYHVFITPEGESNQLYVTQKTPGSFVVREAHGGRSTIAFDYRIVAKPHDENGDRLALAPAIAPPHPAGTLRRDRLPAPQSPDARVREKLGLAGYARALDALRQRLSDK